MFGISYETWKETCNMFFSIREGVHKAYLQWFPFSKLSNDDKEELTSEHFFKKYISGGGFVLFTEVMKHTENFIQKGDGSFRNSVLISPLLFLIIQALGKEISIRYTSQRSSDIEVYYAGNYELSQPGYKHSYDEFYKSINAGREQFQYFIKTDITNFFGSINVNELVNRIDEICNIDENSVTQTQLLLLKELLLYCGDGYYPLVENSMASSYFATVIYLDSIDCELHEFIDSKVDDISSFRMVRYVDDLYILFSSYKRIDKLNTVYNLVRNAYSSILKKHGLALNANKCTFSEIDSINEELKKSLYDEYVNGVKHDMGELFAGKLHVFLTEIYKNVCGNGLTHDCYSKLIEQHFSIENIEFMPEEVLNYLVYENQTELKQSKVSSLLVRIINRDVSFLSIDSKRLTVMVMHTGDNKAVKAMLNQLFIRSKTGVWNSYDTTIAIAYLLQSAFEHNELLGVIYENSPDLYFYYSYGCKTSFICQIREEKSNRYLRCIDNDKKAAFLYFMSVCEKNRANFLGAYAYYKNFFDRVSADMAFKAGIDPKCKKPNYKRYYKEGDLKRLYDGIKGYDVVISKAHQLRNENPLSHSSSGLIDRDSSSRELMDAEQELDNLINQYSANKKL